MTFVNTHGLEVEPELVKDYINLSELPLGVYDLGDGKYFFQCSHSTSAIISIDFESGALLISPPWSVFSSKADAIFNYQSPKEVEKERVKSELERLGCDLNSEALDSITDTLEVWRTYSACSRGDMLSERLRHRQYND